MRAFIYFLWLVCGGGLGTMLTAYFLIAPIPISAEERYEMGVFFILVGGGVALAAITLAAILDHHRITWAPNPPAPQPKPKLESEPWGGPLHGF